MKAKLQALLAAWPLGTDVTTCYGFGVIFALAGAFEWAQSDGVTLLAAVFAVKSSVWIAASVVISALRDMKIEVKVGVVPPHPAAPKPEDAQGINWGSIGVPD